MSMLRRTPCCGVVSHAHILTVTLRFLPSFGSFPVNLSLANSKAAMAGLAGPSHNSAVKGSIRNRHVGIVRAARTSQPLHEERGHPRRAPHPHPYPHPLRRRARALQHRSPHWLSVLSALDGGALGIDHEIAREPPTCRMPLGPSQASAKLIPEAGSAPGFDIA
jgi:hypothetical protein